MDFADLDEREGAFSSRSNFFYGDQVKKIHPPQGLDDWAFDNEYHNLVNAHHQNVIRLIGYCYESRNGYFTHNVEPAMATTMERTLCFEYMEGGGLNKHIQDKSCHLDWSTRYKVIKGVCEGIIHLHSAHDQFAKPVRESMMDKLIADHDKNRVHQPLSILPFFGMGGSGKTRLLDLDFYSPRMFQNIDSKTLLRSIFNRVRQQSLNASLASDRSIKMKIQDTIDFVLGIDKQKTIRKKGMDMDILWCIVDPLAGERNRSQFSVGPDIHPTTFDSLLCAKMCSIYMHARIKPVQKPPSTKNLGTEGVNFSVTDSSLQKGADVSGRIRCPEVDTSFCSPPWVFDSGASVCSTGGLNPLLGLHGVDPVSVANEQDFLEEFRKYCHLFSLFLLDGDCIKTEMKNTRHRRLRKIIRHNKGRRVVSRRCLGHKSRDHKRHDPSRKTRGLVSRSDPTAEDKSSLLTPESTPERTWRVASAAPQHMTGYLHHLTDYTQASGDQFIDTPSMGRMPFHGRGSVNTTNMTLQDVLYVPGLEASLVSTGQLAELGYTIAIGPYGCRVYKDGEGMDLVGKAHYVDGYLLELDFLRVRASTN